MENNLYSNEERIYYTASSVIAVLTNHPRLSVDYSDPAVPFPAPSCPKQNDPDGHCQNDFPECEGKTINCSQKLRLVNEKKNPVIVELFYFINRQNRDGRIKKKNSTLRLIRFRYGLNEAALVDALCT